MAKKTLARDERSQFSQRNTVPRTQSLAWARLIISGTETKKIAFVTLTGHRSVRRLTVGACKKQVFAFDVTARACGHCLQWLSAVLVLIDKHQTPDWRIPSRHKQPAPLCAVMCQYEQVEHTAPTPAAVDHAHHALWCRVSASLSTLASAGRRRRRRGHMMQTGWQSLYSNRDDSYVWCIHTDVWVPLIIAALINSFVNHQRPPLQCMYFARGDTLDTTSWLAFPCLRCTLFLSILSQE